MAQDGNYTFTLADGVDREHVAYPNRYGITIQADLYTPSNLDRSSRHQALLVGSPYGAVKEQAAGIYANELARRGHIALAFDPSYNGYSGGSPRHVSSTDIFVEDFHAGLDYLDTRPFTDRQRLGVVGICASGAFALTAAQVDPRMRALVNVSMIDISANYLPLYTDAQARRAALADLAEQRYLDFDSPSPAMAAMGSPMTLSDDNPMSEFGAFYWREVGHHHNSTTQFTATSDLSFLNFPELAHPEWIETPVLTVVGERAATRALSESIHERLTTDKELLVAPGAGHVDLYHRTDLIPFESIDVFLAKHLG
ncbi:alpha/beta hydrolase [Actinomyces oricola]|mgnify:CR=1 FL=1|uniref:alpha/beta hydrolase n=1 Tax=Actinomyces oricola TaxID=206043 RepID=UPI000FFE9C24|nr:alpha/beta hydrolase [Actinomyces oricola]